jgi:hypothetical protein
MFICELFVVLVVRSPNITSHNRMQMIKTMNLKTVKKEVSVT